MAKKFVISISRDELEFLRGSINETPEAVEDWEFQTRRGSTAQRAKEILAKLKRTLDEKSRERTASNRNRLIARAKPRKLGENSSN
jgi:hypothetical protein